MIIDEADEIYKSGNVDQLYVYLSQYQASDNADILWRLCRFVHKQLDTYALHLMNSRSHNVAIWQTRVYRWSTITAQVALR